MTVQRTHVSHQTRYELHGAAGLLCVLIYTAAPDEPATWKCLLPGPGGTEDLYATHRFLTPDAEKLRAWLTPVIGGDRAAELAEARRCRAPGDRSLDTARQPR
ncbi:MAG TPA: hypothetical protein VGF91_08930 [Solirubrobacteraceae bacterium]|jgi:hypothetical protein